MKFNIEDLHWLAGYLEGEGSFQKPIPSRPNSPRVAFSSTDLDVIVRAANLLGTKVYSLKRQKSHHKDAWCVLITGSSAVEAMKILRPLMGRRRRIQIDRALENWKDPRLKPRLLKDNQVRSIRKEIQKGKTTIISLAKKYKVSHTTISRVVRRTNFYKDVK